MATKKNQIKIRETKENLFNFLKSQFPAIIGNKVWADVQTFDTDDADTSKLAIIFNEEDM